MIKELIESSEFKKLEQDYKFLSRAREQLYKLENEPYIILDCETTGLDPINSEIIEIAALKVEKAEIQGIFNKLIKPQRPLPPEIIRLTGITPDYLQEAPPLSEVIGPFLQFIGNATLVMHNADFDLSFINHHIFQPRKKQLGNPTICTLKVARFLLPNLSNHKLVNLAQYFGIPAKNRHRALGDAETTFELWYKFIPLLREKNLFSQEDLRKIPN
jgi:DNA polymerase III epsilon subunit family exonuclease